MASNGHKNGRGGSLWLQRSYSFVDKDPEVDRFRTLWQKEHIKETELAVLAGCAASTVHNMFGGKTKKPQHATFAKLAGAMGYKYTLQRDDGREPNYEKELPKAREQYRAHKEALRKKREREERRGK
jgi:transcriptional regulator with XRE-family HTH domain